MPTTVHLGVHLPATESTMIAELAFRHANNGTLHLRVHLLSTKSPMTVELALRYDNNGATQRPRTLYRKFDGGSVSYGILRTMYPNVYLRAVENPMVAVLDPDALMTVYPGATYTLRKPDYTGVSSLACQVRCILVPVYKLSMLAKRYLDPHLRSGVSPTIVVSAPRNTSDNASQVHSHSAESQMRALLASPRDVNGGVSLCLTS